MKSTKIKSFIINKQLNKIPFISICVPSYNRAKVLPFALESLIHQLNENDEIVIVDDGSTDDTGSVISHYLKDPRIRFIQKEHTNAPDTRNRAIKEAKNEWIMWMDSDDSLKEGVIEYYRKLMKKYSDVDVFYGDCDYICDSASFNQILVKDFNNKNLELVNRLVYGNQILNGGILIRKSIYEKNGLYDTTFYRCHDYEFWCRVAKKVRFKHAGIKVYNYSQQGADTLSVPSLKALIQDSRVLDKMLLYFPMKDLFYKWNWNHKRAAFSKSCFEISLIYLQRANVESSLKFFRKIADYFPISSEQLRKYLLKSSFLPLDLQYAWIKGLITEVLHNRRSLINSKRISFVNKYRIGSLSKNAGLLEFSKSQFKQLIRDIPKEKRYYTFIGGSYYHLGEISKTIGENIKALEYFKKVLVYIPDHRKAQFYVDSLN